MWSTNKGFLVTLQIAISKNDEDLRNSLAELSGNNQGHR